MSGWHLDWKPVSVVGLLGVALLVANWRSVCLIGVMGVAIFGFCDVVYSLRRGGLNRLDSVYHCCLLGGCALIVYAILHL